MKKNEYVSPDMEIVEIAVESQILAGSPEWGGETPGGGGVDDDI